MGLLPLQCVPQRAGTGGAADSQFYQQYWIEHFSAQPYNIAALRIRRQSHHDPWQSHSKVRRLRVAPRQSHGVAHLLPRSFCVRVAARISGKSTACHHHHQPASIGNVGAAPGLPAGFRSSNVPVLHSTADGVLRAGLLESNAKLDPELRTALRPRHAIRPIDHV